jgi:hypothetical protein
MLEREAGRKLSGRIEVDDALLGGRQGVADGGKQGRGGSNKIPFVPAVETRDGRPQRVQFIPVATHSQAEIARIAKAHFEPGSTIVSDGLACFPAVVAAGCIHEQRTVSRAGMPAMKMPAFRWVNTVLGNLKTAIVGTFKSIRRRYAARYLAEFQTLSAAGRTLFAASRAAKTSTNDADRLKKYLARFSLTWEAVAASLIRPSL